MGILDGLLGPALTVATQSAGAHEQAKQSGSALLRQLGMQQLEQETKRSTLDMNKAHTDLYKAQAAREPKGSWSVHVTENGLVRVNPATGETEPLTMGGQPVQGPAKAQGHVVDPVTGDVKFFDPTKPPQGMKINPVSKPDHFTPVTLQGPDGAQPIIKPFNTKTGTVGESIGNAKQTLGAGGQVARSAAAAIPELKAASSIIDRFDDPTLLNAMSQKAGLLGNYLTTPEGQQLDQAITQFVTLAELAKGNKRPTDAMMERFHKMYAPRPGDSPAMQTQKRQARHTLIDAVSSIGGVAGGAPASLPTEHHTQTIDEMIRAGKSDAEIQAALARGHE